MDVAHRLLDHSARIRQHGGEIVEVGEVLPSQLIVVVLPPKWRCIAQRALQRGEQRWRQRVVQYAKRCSARQMLGDGERGERCNGVSKHRAREPVIEADRCQVRSRRFAAPALAEEQRKRLARRAVGFVLAVVDRHRRAV